MFKGAFTALVTPFKDGRFDEDAFRRLAERQLKAGIDGLVPCGTTGEIPTLDAHEHLAVIKAAVAAAKGRVPVIAGIGTNSTLKTIHQAEAVRPLKPDAFLVTVPYYNRPSQEGLYLHFKAVAKAAKLPIVVYNIPGRTGVNLLPATLARLAKDCPNISAVKEASGSLDQVSAVLDAVPSSFSVLSGDDPLTLPMMSVGATGVISVISNLMPKETAQMCALAAQGKRDAAAKLHFKLLPLTKAIFIESNPAPVKTALAIMGLCGPELRLPMCALQPDSLKILKAALRQAGLL